MKRSHPKPSPTERLGVPISAPNLMKSANKTIFFNIGMWNCPLNLCKFFQGQEKEKKYMTLSVILQNNSKIYELMFFMKCWHSANGSAIFRETSKGQRPMSFNHKSTYWYMSQYAFRRSDISECFSGLCIQFLQHFDLPLTVWYVIINFIMWPTGIFCMRNWRWQGRAGS